MHIYKIDVTLVDGKFREANFILGEKGDRASHDLDPNLTELEKTLLSFNSRQISFRHQAFEKTKRDLSYIESDHMITSRTYTPVSFVD